MSRIIYLNGPSSSGKTTLAKALQQLLDEPYLHIGIDKIIDFMPAKLNNWSGDFAREGFSWQLETDPTGHRMYQIHAGPFAQRITRTLKDIAHLLATQKYNLIIDDVSFGAVAVDAWREVLKEFQVIYVGVRAPLHILEERERCRADRFLGGARGQYFKVHDNVFYDLELDTHTHCLEENLSQILELQQKKFGS